MVNVVDRSSAHRFDYTSYDNYMNVWVPPNITYALQKIDCAVGRYFKCELRCLMVINVLEAVDAALKCPEAERTKFKMNSVMNMFYDVKIMGKAWDMVPRRVVLK